MAISFVKLANGNIFGASAVSAAFPSAGVAATGNFLIVAGQHDDGTSITSVETTGGSGSDSFVQVGSNFLGLSGVHDIFSVWILPACGAGRTGAQINFSGSTPYADCFVWEVSGLPAAIADVIFESGLVNGNNISASSGSLSTANEFAICFGVSAGAYAGWNDGGATNPFNPANGWTYDKTDPGTGAAAGHQITSATTALTARLVTDGGTYDNDFVIITFMSSAGAAAPFSQTGWPNPTRRASHHAALAHVDPSEFWLFAGAPAVPFAGRSQQNPVLRRSDVSNLGFVDPSEFWLVMPVGQQAFPQPRGAFRTIAHDGFVEVPSPAQLLTGAKPFSLLHQPNPVLRRGDVSNLGHVDPSEHWLFASPNPKPFAQTDWPVPRGPAPRLNGGYADASEFWMLQDTFFGAPGQPPQPFNWPLPRPSGRLNAGFVDAYPNRVVTVVAAPFAQYDWPLPRGRQAALVGFVSSYAVNFLQPASQADWPVPGRRSPLNTGFASPGLAAGIPYSLDRPFFQADWPVPKGRPPLNGGYVASGLALVVAPPPPAPVAQTDWPLPGRGRQPLNVGFTVAGLAGGVPYSSDLPFSQDIWPVPPGRAWSIRGFVSSGLALTVVDLPFAQYDWPVPRSRFSGVRGFVSQAEAARLTVLTSKPFAQNHWPNPVRSRVVAVASSMRPSQNVTIRLPVDGYIPRSDGAALLI